MLDVKLLDQKDLRRWVHFVLSLATAAFVSFCGAFGLAGASVLAARDNGAFSFWSALFAGSTVMAAATFLTAKASPLWKELSIRLPHGTQEILERADPASSSAAMPSPDDVQKRNLLADI